MILEESKNVFHCRGKLGRDRRLSGFRNESETRLGNLRTSSPFVSGLFKYFQPFRYTKSKFSYLYDLPARPTFKNKDRTYHLDTLTLT